MFPSFRVCFIIILVVIVQLLDVPSFRACFIIILVVILQLLDVPSFRVLSCSLTQTTFSQNSQIIRYTMFLGIFGNYFVFINLVFGNDGRCSIIPIIDTGTHNTAVLFNLIFYNFHNFIEFFMSSDISPSVHLVYILALEGPQTTFLNYKES